MADDATLAVSDVVHHFFPFQRVRVASQMARDIRRRFRGYQPRFGTITRPEPRETVRGIWQ